MTISSSAISSKITRAFFIWPSTIPSSIFPLIILLMTLSVPETERAILTSGYLFKKT